MIHRTLQMSLERLSTKYPVITLAGPRQSGKSTLLKHAFPDYQYISLEDLDMREFAANDPRGFLATTTGLQTLSGRLMTIDEVDKA